MNSAAEPDYDASTPTGDLSRQPSTEPPDHPRAGAPEMIHGVHLALRILGLLTIVTTVVFSELQPNDGAAVSSHKTEVPAQP